MVILSYFATVPPTVLGTLLMLSTYPENKGVRMTNPGHFSMR